MKAIRPLCVLCLLLLRFTLGQGGTEGIQGPEFLVTNGSRELNLTCFLGGPKDRYQWFTPGKNTSRCGLNTEGQVCTFLPTLEDDNKNVTCTLVDESNSSTASYLLNLKYPPQSEPNITKQTPKGDPTNHEQVITCSVSGGKPPVTNVTFYCQNPDLADQPDDVIDDGTTVTSDVTVDTSQFKELNITCTCSAHWEPEPDLYNITIQQNFDLAYFQPSQERSKGLLGTEAIAGIVVATVLGVGVVVVIIIVCRRRRQHTDQKQHTRYAADNKAYNPNEATHDAPNSSNPRDSRPDSTATDTYDKVADETMPTPTLANDGYATADECQPVKITNNNSGKDEYNHLALTGRKVPQGTNLRYAHVGAEAQGKQPGSSASSASPYAIAEILGKKEKSLKDTVVASPAKHAMGSTEMDDYNRIALNHKMPAPQSISSPYAEIETDLHETQKDGRESWVTPYATATF